MKLSVSNTLTIISDKGKIELESGFTSLLLILIAIAPKHCIHRQQALKLLWPKVDSPFNTNNLRQVTFRLRSKLKSIGLELHSKSQQLWIDDLVVDWEIKPIIFLNYQTKTTNEILEWVEQLSTEPKKIITKSKPSLTHIEFKPIIQLIRLSPFCERILNDLNDFCLDRLATHLRWNGLITPTELTEDEATILNVDRRTNNQTHTLKLQVFKVLSEITIRLDVHNRGEHIWSDRIICSEFEAKNHNAARLNAFMARTVHSMEQAILKRLDLQHNSSIKLHNSIQSILSMNSQKTFNGLNQLETMIEKRPFAEAMAWQVLGKMITIGECMSPKDNIANCENLVLQAIQDYSGHPMVLAMTAHYYMYYEKDSVSAKELLDLAVDIAPHHPLVNDTLGTYYLYQDQTQLAEKFLKQAEASSFGSSYQHYVQASRLMLFTMTGQHKRAELLSNRLLKQFPDFKVVKRYAMCSHFKMGNVVQAEKLHNELYRNQKETKQSLYSKPMMANSFEDLLNTLRIRLSA